MGCLAGMLLLAAVPARAGEVAGTVRGIGGAPLADRLVSLIGNFGGMSATTDGAGHYSFPGLAAGTYYAKVNILATWPAGVPDPDGLVGELYSKIPCPLNGCTETSGTEIAVPASGVVTIDFDLKPGSRIRGTVSASGGGGLAGITVNAYDAKGRYVASTNSDGTGAYTIQGIPGGRYFLHTYSAGARADVLYPGIPCGNNQCAPTTGTAVEVAGAATVTGIDFALPVAGKIAGTVTDGGGNPVADAIVEVWNGAQRFGYDFQTDAAGAYLVEGLPAATTFRVLARKAGLVTAVHPAAPCPNVTCDFGSTGNAITVVAGSTTSGRNIQLFPGHSISGTVASGGLVKVIGASGVAGTANGGPSYLIGDLPDGSYRVRAERQGTIAEWWNNRECAGDFFCVADSVNLAGANVTGINFDLSPAGAIRGRVTDAANGDPIGLLQLVATWANSGTFMSDGLTSADGTYETSSQGLPPGTYRLRTTGPAAAPDYADEIWNDHPCEPSCAPATGDAITVTGTAATIGVDLALSHSGTRYFTVTPCRVYDSRVAGGPLSSDVSYPFRIEAQCGIPGHAMAVSANLTVISSTASGSLSFWPFNLSAVPPTSVLSIKPGVARANNAMLTMSLRGFSNVLARASLLGGGTYHLIVDVNGYFAPTVSP